jgi:hypothetical protein
MVSEEKPIGKASRETSVVFVLCACLSRTFYYARLGVVRSFRPGDEPSVELESQASYNK